MTCRMPECLRFMFKSCSRPLVLLKLLELLLQLLIAKPSLVWIEKAHEHESTFEGQVPGETHKQTNHGLQVEAIQCTPHS